MTRVAEIQNRFSTEQLMTGVRMRQWLKVLKKNNFDVHPEYYHRAAFLTGMSAVSSALGRVEDALYGRQIAEMEIDPAPLFVLGHWRSGTTHLHGLLGRDPSHTYSTLWQVVFPSAMLITRNLGPALLKGALPEKRSYDNMAQGWFEAAEDEIALAKLTGLSMYMGFMFPDQAASYEKYMDFFETTHQERQLWKKQFEIFVKKIMIQTGGKRVIVKSCPHSSRIRLLLEMFPNAKFVHIHRNPYEVFASMLHMRSKVDWENFVQRPEVGFLAQRWEQTAVLGRNVFERIVEDRHLIPPENFVELSYEEFAGNELPHLKAMYEKFGLPQWDRYERTITPYLDSLKGYKRNKLQIDAELQAFVYDRWRFVFDTYGYPQQYPPPKAD